MRFEWDEEKRLANWRKHGIDFADVENVFADQVYTIIDERFDYGEIRYFTLGLLSGRVIAVSHTETDNAARIISARKANKNEEAKYFREIKN
jgi:hypothetical protein